MEINEAFNRIYTETKQPLLRWLIPRVQGSADVDDLMQDIYDSLYRQLQKGNAVREPMAYLYGIAKKILSRYYRGREKVQVCEEPLSEETADNAPLPEERFFRMERAREVWTIVKQEPTLSYQAFTLYYGFEIPTVQIAEELGISEEAVRKRLSRTRARIRAMLQEDPEDLSTEKERSFV